MRLLLILAVFVAQNALAEDVFYIEKVQIKSVNCGKGQIVLSDRLKTEYSIRTSFASKPEKLKPVCPGLRSFAEKDTSITLLLAPVQMVDNYISKLEVIGYVDVDYVVAAWDYIKVNKVFKEICGNYTRGNEVCVWKGDDERNFITINSSNTGTQYFSAQLASDGALNVRDASENPPRNLTLQISANSVDQSLLGNLLIDGKVDYPPFKMRKVPR